MLKLRTTLLIILIILSYFISALPIMFILTKVYEIVGINIIYILPILYFILYPIFLTFLGIFLSLSRHVIPLPKPGKYKLNSKNDKYGFIRGIPFNLFVTSLGLFKGIMLNPIIYKLFGLKVGKNCIISGKLINMEYIKIGNNTIIGDRCLLTAHIIQNNYIIYDNITIGNNCTIGAEAIIYPKVKIEDNSIIGGNTVIPYGKKIPKNTIWIGAKPKKIGKNL